MRDAGDVDDPQVRIGRCLKEDEFGLPRQGALDRVWVRKVERDNFDAELLQPAREEGIGDSTGRNALPAVLKALGISMCDILCSLDVKLLALDVSPKEA